MDDKDKKFAESFDLKEEEVAEAKNNLVGFFEVLYNINERLKNKEK
ncbi:MAG: hypothetical protein WC473_02880 [Patescibacteria group bacterium]